MARERVEPVDVDDQRPYGDFTPGRFAWVLADIEAVTPPIPAKGRQQMWEWQREEVPACGR